MALSSTNKIYMGILDDFRIELRKTRVITDDDGETYEKHHREVLEPDQDISSYPGRVRQVAATLWTPQVISDYKAAKTARIAASTFP